MDTGQIATSLLYFCSASAQCWAIGFGLPYAMSQWRMSRAKEEIVKLGASIAALATTGDISSNEASQLQAGKYELLDEGRRQVLVQNWLNRHRPNANIEKLNPGNDEEFRRWLASIAKATADAIALKYFHFAHARITKLLRV